MLLAKKKAAERRGARNGLLIALGDPPRWDLRAESEPVHQPCRTRDAIGDVELPADQRGRPCRGPHRASTQPCAAGPCSRYATSFSRQRGDRRHRDPLGPRETRAPTPPVRHNCYHW